MGLLEFNKLPINTLVGADWKTFNAITKGREIDAAYKGKFRLTKAVCRMLSTLAPLQDKRYEKLLADKPLEHDPVFILGHWRSGTTFVHNVFSCDKHFGYNTTYQTVFPHLMMWGQPFFKKNMSWLMPDKRPTDNMELAVDLPQEEEFALANMMPYTYYNFWFLPKHQQEYADKYLLFDDISEAELKVFEETFTRLIKISLWNTHGTQFLSKNPPHTGRVKELVKMFPNAKFIYLMRNPYTVFESTRSFFTNTIQPLKLQDITPAELEQNILSIYAKRVGTVVVRYYTTTDDWRNNATYSIMYGDITGNPEYKAHMMRLQVQERYAVNSKGESVPIKEVAWGTEDDIPTHIQLQFTSSHGGAYIGSPGNSFYVDNVKLVY